ncbi:MAG: hypothetical protein M3Q71_05535 [Chloroflexota bacterium]|nr:hypothetical protein [Chloroflexota bacterium]MDP9470118.1 hypothetical protein [Chloroflexota bacterium]
METQAREPYLAIDTLGHLLALQVMPAKVQDREQVGALAQAVQGATGDTGEVACSDQGCTW